MFREKFSSLLIVSFGPNITAHRPSMQASFTTCLVKIIWRDQQCSKQLDTISYVSPSEVGGTWSRVSRIEGGFLRWSWWDLIPGLSHQRWVSPMKLVGLDPGSLASKVGFSDEVGGTWSRVSRIKGRFLRWSWWDLFPGLSHQRWVSPMKLVGLDPGSLASKVGFSDEVGGTCSRVSRIKGGTILTITPQKHDGWFQFVHIIHSMCEF